MTGPKRGDTAATWRPGTNARLGQPGETGQTEAPAQPEAAAPPGTELVMGQVIAGTRYRLLSTIGEGGMGTVYAAEHVDLEKKVALKLLRADIASDAEALRGFRQEARAA